MGLSGDLLDREVGVFSPTHVGTMELLVKRILIEPLISPDCYAQSWKYSEKDCRRKTYADQTSCWGGRDSHASTSYP